jgi:hypothetical protein
MSEILYCIQRVFNFDRSVTVSSMKHRLLFLLAVFSLSAYPQPWSTFLDSSRAIDWTGAGFTIPNYNVNCATQPTLTAGTSAASANTTAIQNALASCDATHNVVNLPAGTYYVAGVTYGSQGHQVLRGAGPNSTDLILTAPAGCGGSQHGVCMIDGNPQFNGSVSVLPPSGTQQCLWTAGYTKGTTTITLNSCPGGGPPVNHTLILDQANDAADTGGVFICDASLPGCTTQSGDYGGRNIGGVTHTSQQIVMVTGVTGSGTGPYTVTISPGLYANNFRSGQSPGAWWPGFVQNDGLENMTLDGNALASPEGTMAFFNCYQCWVKNIRFLNGGRNHILIMQSAQDAIRDSYFYGAQGSSSQSYGIEFEACSGILVENNIMQQVTASFMFGVGTGVVMGYNYVVNSVYTPSSYFQGSYYGHAGGNQMHLWEGNSFLSITTDDLHGTTATGTFFRNIVRGWQPGASNATFAIAFRANHRANNMVGNVLGQPGYHTPYESYATSTTGGVNAGGANNAIYELGWVDDGGTGVCTSVEQPVVCDPKVRPTLMRWGNWDVVNNAVRWDATEASPAAVTYVNANFTPSYFSSLAHTLPASLYYSSKPSWWPATKAWPTVGPDVTTGNLGTCSGGTYAGAQATASSQCTGGTFSVQYASHATSIPAQDCYLNTMHGPPDGSGGVLSFDASLCYGITSTPPPTSTRPASPTRLTSTVH